MRTHARHTQSERTQGPSEEEHERIDAFELLTGDDGAFGGDGYEIVRVRCPDCARPIALLADEVVLPQHAVCPAPWDPFGLRVCPGSGRAAQDAAPADGQREADEPEWASLLTLPAGLNWRTQPFSHMGGPGSQPIRVPVQRAA
jgi:hypothetical protein